MTRSTTAGHFCTCCTLDNTKLMMYNSGDRKEWEV